MALTQKYLGGYFGLSRDNATSLQYHRRAYDLDQARVLALPDDATAQLDLAIDISSIAGAHFAQGDYGQAIAGYEETLAIRKRLAEADPKDLRARGMVGYAHQQLASSHHRAGHRELARRHIAQAFEVNERIPGDAFRKAEAYLTLGEVEGGRTPAGCAAYRNADRLLTEAAAAGVLNSGADEKRAFAAREAAACRAR